MPKVPPVNAAQCNPIPTHALPLKGRVCSGQRREARSCRVLLGEPSETLQGGERSSLRTAGSDDLERPTGRTGMGGDGFCRAGRSHAAMVFTDPAARAFLRAPDPSAETPRKTGHRRFRKRIPRLRAEGRRRRETSASVPTDCRRTGRAAKPCDPASFVARNLAAAFALDEMRRLLPIGCDRRIRPRGDGRKAPDRLRRARQRRLTSRPASSPRPSCRRAA